MFEGRIIMEDMKKKGERISIALIGFGKMGQSLASQIIHMGHIWPRVIVDHSPNKVKEALLAFAIQEELIFLTEDFYEAESFLASKKDGIVVTAKEDMGAKIEEIACVVDATGSPFSGARIAYDAIENEKHIVMLNVECDSVVGPYLYQKALEKGVIYTGSKGDEPAAIIELLEFAANAGLEVVVAGKGKNNPLDFSKTPSSLKEEAEKKGLAPKMLTSFVDGTNTMAELCIVSNATGYLAPKEGFQGITAGPNEIADHYKEAKGPFLDFAFGMAPGVYVIVTSFDPERRKLLSYLGLGQGPMYTLYRPYHLTSLETPMSIVEAVVEHKASICPMHGQVSDVIAIAKRDLKEGEYLSGIGDKDCYGILIDHKEQKLGHYVPIALLNDKVKVIRDIPRGSRLRYEDIYFEEESFLLSLRRLQDQEEER